MLIDKPIDWTSFDVVNLVRSVLRESKVGHAGTLDPKATGLLMVCTGKKTKAISTFSNLSKEYTGVIELGACTPSFDSETEITKRCDYSMLSIDDIQRAINSFLGYRQQIPPMYSAVKYAGKPLYKFARKGKTVKREPREIFIESFDLLHVELPFIKFRINCSKGTYIRSIAHELGDLLGVGGYLKELRRTRIGSYRIEDAVSVAAVRAMRKTLSAPSSVSTS